ncbi:MAG: hypothetical protein AAF787_00020 [Chloroflexota bacterium]
MMKHATIRNGLRFLTVVALMFSLFTLSRPPVEVSAQTATEEPGFVPVIDAGTDVINATNTDVMVIVALVIVGIVIVASVIAPQLIQMQSVNKLVDTVAGLAESPITRATAAPVAATVDSLNDAFIERILSDGKPGNDALGEWIHQTVDRYITERLEQYAGTKNMEAAFGKVPGDTYTPDANAAVEPVPQEAAP